MYLAKKKIFLVRNAIQMSVVIKFLVEIVVSWFHQYKVQSLLCFFPRGVKGHLTISSPIDIGIKT